jgi:hypothetical protein
MVLFSFFICKICIVVHQKPKIMTLRFRFRPILVLFSIVFFLFVTGTTAAATGDTSSPHGVVDWLGKNWAVVAVVLSEAMAFLPTKAHGILQGLCNIVEAILKKK